MGDNFKHGGIVYVLGEWRGGGQTPFTSPDLLPLLYDVGVALQYILGLGKNAIARYMHSHLYIFYLQCWFCHHSLLHVNEFELV